ncbi:MAG: exosortase/archaeosortase family protein [Pirellulales bacterium]
MRSMYRAVCFCALVVSLIWAFWPAIQDLMVRWSSDPSYSHGYLVPLFSIYLLWQRRKLAGMSSPALVWGLAFLAVGTLLELAAGLLMVRTLAHYSLPFFLAGVCLALAGWKGMKWAWPAIVFLFFMVPLPGPIADMLGHPLQRVATITATYVVQLIGVPAVAQGNVILLTNEQLGVAEACSGLRMLVSFVTFSTGAVLLVDRKLWEKGLILASAVPIAIICNVTRITVTAAMYEWVNAEVAEKVFHDLAGWLMMPLALALLATELKLISSLFVEVEASAPLEVARSKTGEKKRPRSSEKRAARPKAIRVR